MHLGQLRRIDLVVASFALVALVFVFYGCGTTSRDDGPPDTVETEKGEPNRVKLEPEIQNQLGLQYISLERRRLSRELRLTGQVEPNARRIATVRALTRGRLQSVRVTIGDRVEEGQVLAVYDDIELGDLIVQRAAATAARQRSETEAAVTQEAVERARHLVEIGALALAEKQRREADYAQALSRIEEARTEVDQIDQKIRRLGGTPRELEKRLREDASSADGLPLLSTITAPFSGVLTEANAAEGELIDPTTALFKIVDISSVWVQGDLHEKDIGLIHQGKRATVKATAYPDRRFEGQITYISDFLDPTSRTARVRCEVPNRRFDLKLGMFVTLAIPVSEGSAVVAVPVSAIQRINDQPVVFVRRSPDLFQKRGLRTGRRGDHWVEVLGGVSTGEEVVTEGSFQLKAILLRGSLAEED